MTNQNETSDKPAFIRQRKLRNYLLDVGLQLRYTGFIIAVAVLLTGILGYKVYRATQESTRIVLLTVQADPATGAALQSQFEPNDRVVLYGIVGFGLILVLSITAAGIWITHKVAGPLYNISTTCASIRDDYLPPVLRQLRRGDQLQSFHAQFGDMYAALRTRAAADLLLLDKTITAIEAISPRNPELDKLLAELRAHRDRKQASLGTAQG